MNLPQDPGIGWLELDKAEVGCIVCLQKEAVLVSGWRHGVRTPPDLAGFRPSNALEDDPILVAALALAETRRHTPPWVGVMRGPRQVQPPGTPFKDTSD